MAEPGHAMLAYTDLAIKSRDGAAAMEQIEQILATVHALLRAEGMSEAAAIVRDFPAHIQQTGYDNWNGGYKHL